MAEDPDQQPPDPIGQRIRDYFASPEAAKHFFEGFASQSDAYKLAQIAQNESRRYRLPDEQGELRQRSAAGEEKLRKCQILGHQWFAGDANALSMECARCGMVLQTGLPWDSRASWDALFHLEEELAAEPEVDPHLICIWCGRICTDLEALDLHEEECEPA